MNNISTNSGKKQIKELQKEFPCPSPRGFVPLQSNLSKTCQKPPPRAPHLSALVAAPPGQMPPCRERGVFFGVAVAVAVGWVGSHVFG